jgi:cell division protein FtsI (penicillin-binding protein 3)
MDDRYFRGWVIAITAVFCGCFSIIGAKLCCEHMKTPDGEVAKTRDYDRVLKAVRGKIYDCNGTRNPMAMSLYTRVYFVDPHPNSVELTHRTNLVPVVRSLADAFGVDEKKIWQKYLTISPEGYQALLHNNPDRELWGRYRGRNRRNVIAVSPDEDVYTVVTNRALVSGVGIENKVVRTYPGRRRMSHVLGFANNQGVGSAGVESRYDSYLRGVDGRVEGQKDARGHIISYRRNMIAEPIDGSDVFLTLDDSIQLITEKALRNVVGQFGAEGGWAIVQRVKSGAILAMASFPDFEPEYYNNVNSNIWANKTITVNYEPGSVMKPVLACAALNHGIIDENTLIDAGLSKVWFYGGKPLRDHVTGQIDLRKALVKSSNIYFGKLGLMMGNECIYRYLRGFNFGSKLGIDLGGEQFGILHQPQRWDSLSPTRIPMGQGVAVTALQMINAFSCIANDGVLMKPYVVDRVVSQKGEVMFKNTPTVIGRPVRKEVARTIREMMIGITRPGGTGTRAAVEGYTVAGKTGTAQKPVAGGYSQTDYYATFVGFIPAVNPEIAILVTVDTPRPQHTGGFVAAPVFAEIASTVVQYLEIPPDDLETQEAL